MTEPKFTHLEGKEVLVSLLNQECIDQPNDRKTRVHLGLGKPETLECHQSVQFSSVTQSCPTLCDPMNHSTPGLPVHHHLPEFTQTHVYRVRDAIRPSHPGSSPSPPVPNLSQHQSLFSNESTLHLRCPKYGSFSFGIIPSKEIPGLIPFRMD